MRENNKQSERRRLRYALELAGHIKGFGAYLFFAILSNLIYKVLPLITSLVTAYMVSSVLAENASQIIRLMVAAGILVILMAVFSYLDVQVGHDMAYRILAQLRNKCYDKLDELAPAALMGKRSGDMISIILNDVELLEWFYAHTISQVIVAVVIPVAALVFMGLFSWILPVVIIPFILILLMIPRRSAKRSDAQGTQVREATGKLSAILVDGVQGIKDIISFRWQREYLERFFRINAEYAEASLNYAKRRANEHRGITLVMELASLAANITSVVLVVTGSISALWLLRLPRALLAIAAGGGLAVAGAAMQAVTQNVLADPYILGASGGASAAVAFAYVLGGAVFTSGTAISAFAFGGAMLALLLVYSVGMVGNAGSGSRLVLSGIAVSVILTAATQFFISIAPDTYTVRNIMAWTMGSLSGARWHNLAFPFFGSLIGSAFFIGKARPSRWSRLARPSTGSPLRFMLFVDL